MPAYDDPKAQAEAFASGLFNPHIEPPYHAKSAKGDLVNKRYDVYRNNATVSLINALSDIFPAVEKIIGPDLFRHVARGYVRTHPPRSKLLFRYGEWFDAFIATQPETGKFGYLPDIARAERAWLTAFHAADDVPLDPSRVASIEPHSLPNARFKRHAATHLIVSDFPVFEIFAMNRDLMPLGQVDMMKPQAVLITRPQCEVQVTAIDAATAHFIDMCDGNIEFEQAVADTIEHYPDFNLQAALGVALRASAFTDVATDIERGL